MRFTPPPNPELILQVNFSYKDKADVTQIDGAYMQHVMRRMRAHSGAISIETEFSTDGAKLMGYILDCNAKCDSELAIVAIAERAVSCVASDLTPWYVAALRGHACSSGTDIASM